LKIFIDSADPLEIQHWLGEGIIDGVTTNPSIMLKDGMYDIEEGARKLCRIVRHRPCSIEVTSNDREEMLEQGRMFSSWGSNIVVKVPVVNERGESSLSVINTLTSEHIAVNATAVLSFNQAVLATKAGATYVSIFAGRISDEGNDPSVVIRNVRHWIGEWSYPTEIIVGSVRSVIDVQNAALAGAHIVTVPPQFLPKMIDHKYTRETVGQFVRDAEKALKEIARVRLEIS
jgi:transaldolase